MDRPIPMPDRCRRTARLRRLTGWWVGIALGLALVALWPVSAPALELFGSLRDAFPVFNEPRVLTAAQAEAQGAVLPRDAVLGITLGGEARAYPIAVMGIHELGNDTLGGVPIAVSW